MKKKLSTVLLLGVLLVGLALLLYPTASDYWNSFHQSQAIATYAETVAEMSTADYEQIWLNACAYNKKLEGRTTPYLLSEEEWADYLSQLNVSGNGVMGYIDIPKINCTLPIYHGTADTVLQVAVGHIESSSLPVGGVPSHCVVSGHRGLPSAKLFTDLDQLAEGDYFQMQILNETLTYEVDQIRIVLPEEMDELGITEGQDYCTLVTCTPYGINSHRLLVRGTRIENPSSGSARITSDATRIDPMLVAPVVAAPMLLLLAVWLVVDPGGKKKKKKDKVKKNFKKNITP